MFLGVLDRVYLWTEKDQMCQKQYVYSLNAFYFAIENHGHTHTTQGYYLQIIAILLHSVLLFCFKKSLFFRNKPRKMLPSQLQAAISPEVMLAV